MKITEINPQIQSTETELEKFSKRKFTLELNGFELLVLNFISKKIGGIGKIRSVFSRCGCGIVSSSLENETEQIFICDNTIDKVLEQFNEKINEDNIHSKKHKAIYVYDDHR